MAQIFNISEQVKLNCCGEKFYDFFVNKMDYYVHMFPQRLKSYKFVEGNGFTHGSVTHWKYDFGIPAEVKTRLLVDEPNKAVIFECLEGDLLKDFEMFQVKVQVTDGGKNAVSSVKWSVEFMKANEDVAPPHNYLQFGVDVCKGLDAYLSKKLMN
ncbi:MLP-like protein 31 [Benincasa hispida]|uniref:MLP-like protein 31 n=1 Tax=Benincasa hispida TaxID=102211 RepID=UPI0018FF5DCD|nr:MLP-like protein 31 [Benincasa hispida]